MKKNNFVIGGLAALLAVTACNPVPEAKSGKDTTYVPINSKSLKTQVTDYIEYDGVKFEKETEPIKNAKVKWITFDNLAINSSEESFSLFYDKVILDVAGKERILVSKERLDIAPGNSYDVHYKKLLPGQRMTNELLLNAFIVPDIYNLKFGSDIHYTKKLNKRIEGVIDSMVYLGPQGGSQ